MMIAVEFKPCPGCSGLFFKLPDVVMWPDAFEKPSGHREKKQRIDGRCGHVPHRVMPDDSDASRPDVFCAFHIPADLHAAILAAAQKRLITLEWLLPELLKAGLKSLSDGGGNPNPEDYEVVRSAAGALWNWSHPHGKRWDLTVSLGGALRGLHERAVRRAGGNSGRGFTEAMSDLLKSSGLSTIDKTTRFYLIKCYEHREEIGGFMAGLWQAHRRRPVHPRRIWEAYQADRKKAAVETSGEADQPHTTAPGAALGVIGEAYQADRKEAAVETPGEADQPRTTAPGAALGAVEGSVVRRSVVRKGGARSGVQPDIRSLGRGAVPIGRAVSRNLSRGPLCRLCRLDAAHRRIDGAAQDLRGDDQRLPGC
jgi:hypothetical protein